MGSIDHDHNIQPSFLKKIQVQNHKAFFEITPGTTNMTIENQPFEYVSPIENGDFPVSC